MSQVNRSQQLSAQASLDRSLRLVIEDLENRVWLLLGLFRPDAELELANGVKYYSQRLYLWHERSQHGPAIQRIFVYDTGTGASGSLEELDLVVEPAGFKEVPWDEGLVQVRRSIREHGLPAGDGLMPTRSSTWMFHPEAMVLLRLIGAYVPSSRRRLHLPAVTGYLILKLDLEYIRDRLIRDTLNDRFGAGPLEFAYTIDLALDGNPLLRYELAGNGGTEAPHPAPSAAPYSLRRWGSLMP